MHAPTSDDGPASMATVQPTGPSHSLHVPFRQSTTPGEGHGHVSSKVMDATSASYRASALLLIGVLPQSQELEQTVPVVTTVQSAAVLQLWLKLEAGTVAAAATASASRASASSRVASGGPGDPSAACGEQPEERERRHENVKLRA